jgi:hypothetical protein
MTALGVTSNEDRKKKEEKDQMKMVVGSPTHDNRPRMVRF